MEGVREGLPLQGDDDHFASQTPVTDFAPTPLASPGSRWHRLTYNEAITTEGHAPRSMTSSFDR